MTKTLETNKLLRLRMGSVNMNRGRHSLFDSRFALPLLHSTFAHLSDYLLIKVPVIHHAILPILSDITNRYEQNITIAVDESRRVPDRDWNMN
jgi:hypothetical protein